MASTDLPPSGARRETLALAYQELFTVIVRLRSNRQAVGDANSFRANMRAALGKAEQDAVGVGYSPEEVRFASFAVVAFLDESILGSGSSVSADWARKPLQEELYRTNRGGEIFYESLEYQLKRQDSPSLADLLEVYELCLLLGFKGRLSAGGAEATRPIQDSVSRKIERVRGPAKPLSAQWAPTSEFAAPRSHDPWVRRWVVIAAACLVLALALFGGFRMALNSGISDLRVAAQR
jgi:type VI secretion system protein ImpK